VNNTIQNELLGQTTRVRAANTALMNKIIDQDNSYKPIPPFAASSYLISIISAFYTALGAASYLNPNSVTQDFKDQTVRSIITCIPDSKVFQSSAED
jgi:hypothetical protein